MDRERVSKEFDIVNNRDRLLLFIIIAEKGFTWYNDLDKSYAITQRTIYRSKDILMELGYITITPFHEIDMIYQEAIMKVIPNPEHFYRENPTCFCITPEGRIFYDNIKNTINTKRENPTFNDLLGKILKRTQSYRDVYNAILYEENNTLQRLVKLPNGITISKKTDRAQEIEEQARTIGYLKKNNPEAYKLMISQESNEEQLALSIAKGTNLKVMNTELMLRDKKDLEKIKNRRSKITYNGIYANDRAKLVKALRPITNKDIEANKSIRLDGKHIEKKTKERPYDDHPDNYNNFGTPISWISQGNVSWKDNYTKEEIQAIQPLSSAKESVSAIEQEFNNIMDKFR